MLTDSSAYSARLWTSRQKTQNARSLGVLVDNSMLRKERISSRLRGRLISIVVYVPVHEKLDEIDDRKSERMLSPRAEIEESLLIDRFVSQEICYFFLE